MKIKSAKAKGRLLQNLVRDKLREVFVFTSKLPKLEVDDIKSQTMGMTGEDIVLSPKARQMIPYSFECKNVEKLQFWATVTQAENNLQEGCVPAIVVKKNRQKPYVAVPLDHFIQLLKGEV
tara:strand:+ start:215 stop:577 length:363 start_codon:yes stop_codon:yes gene_type:complete